MRKSAVYISNQTKLLFPQDMSFYDQQRDRSKFVATKEKRFRAFNNLFSPDRWLIYSNDSSFVEIGERVIHHGWVNTKITCDADNIGSIKGNPNYRLINEYFAGTILVQGSSPQQIQHNKEFWGLDWRREAPYCAIVFLRYVV